MTSLATSAAARTHLGLVMVGHVVSELNRVLHVLLAGERACGNLVNVLHMGEGEELSLCPLHH